MEAAQGAKGTTEVTSLTIFFFFLATLHNLWDLSFPTKDWTCALGSESAES